MFARNSLFSFVDSVAALSARASSSFVLRNSAVCDITRRRSTNTHASVTRDSSAASPSTDKARSRVHQDGFLIATTSAADRSRILKDCALPMMSRSIRQIPVMRSRLPSGKSSAISTGLSRPNAVKVVLPCFRISTSSFGSTEIAVNCASRATSAESCLSSSITLSALRATGAGGGPVAMRRQMASFRIGR